MKIFNLTYKDIQRFFSKIKYDNSCWKWLGEMRKDTSTSRLIPRFSISREYKCNKIEAYRIAFQIILDEYPEGNLSNICGNDYCINPFHFKTESKKKYHKTIVTGRYRNLSLKTINQVICMRKLGNTGIKIADKTGLYTAQVYMIIKMARYCKDNKLKTKGQIPKWIHKTGAISY